jgi:hypothetical protein
MVIIVLQREDGVFYPAAWESGLPKTASQSLWIIASMISPNVSATRTWSDNAIRNIAHQCRGRIPTAIALRLR